MAITQTMCSSFKLEVFEKVHNLASDTIMLALYTSAATLGAATTAYTASNEVAAGGGYTTGGMALTGAAVSLDGTTAIVDFNDATWATATITARGALLYNATAANKAIAVLDFGADKTSTAGDFTVIMPIAAAATALIRGA